MCLEKTESVLGCDVEFSILALSVHAVCHMEFIVTICNRDPDLFSVCEMSERDFVQIDAHTNCDSQRGSHTVDLDDTVLRKDESVTALSARSVSGNVLNFTA
jgi:hypothetical protein